ncbi:hypothetical protein KAW65_03835 [candidate division WOR-3 bacterium]|nr:hypothetical protein [candidate division WOR-3 bacterium]
MINHIFKENGLIAKKMPDYEERQEQILMAQAIDNIIKQKKPVCRQVRHLICEAGTGVGKSLAYLVPFILWAKNNKKKIIVSTYTKTLQHQLLTKDIPLLQSALNTLPLKFTALAAFGSKNYLCLRRWHKLADKGLFLTPEDKEIEKLTEWEASTETGLRSELEKNGKVKIFSEVARDPDLCLGKKCKFREICYYERARRKLFKTDLIITNHWLFFANLAAHKKVLPAYHGIIFDEAQNLEAVATEYFGIHLSNYKFDFFFNSLKKEIVNHSLNQIINEAQLAKEDFFREIFNFIDNNNVTRITAKSIVPNLISPFLNDISLLLKKLRKNAKDEEESEEIGRWDSKCKALDTELALFLNQLDPASIYWLETVKHHKTSLISLNTAPIIIAPYMKKYVFDPEIPIVLTSATLTVDKSFDFISKRLGLKNKEEVYLFSSFDYKKNVILYIPEDGPDPRARQYYEFVAQEIKKLIKITNGRALVLFTSFELMNKVYGQIKASSAQIEFLKQGDASRDELLKRFNNPALVRPPAVRRAGKCGTILFGVASFWQGIDIPGDALLQVIITRLPFDVPDSPIIQARMEWIKQQGDNPFWEYQLPQAVMILKQGFGRLIRKCTDYGLVAILDTRIRKRWYGKKFLNSLPDCKLTSNLAEVKSFFSTHTSLV